MRTKKKNYLWHLICLVFSEEYREALEYDAGERLWEQVNHDLPEARGVINDDKERVQMFAERFKTSLTSKEQSLLIKWIRNRLYSLEHDFCENISGAVIAYERKWTTIYHEHLDAIC